VTAFTPYAWRTWLVLAVAGLVGDYLLHRARREKLSAEGQARWRLMQRRNALSSFVVVIFWIGVYAVLEPRSLNQYCAFPAILMGVIYASIGVWASLPRYLWLGLSISVLTLLGYFFLAPWFPLWMAAVGGGGLMLGGLWMRKA
jgi:hypothetical protein